MCDRFTPAVRAAAVRPRGWVEAEIDVDHALEKDRLVTGTDVAVCIFVWSTIKTYVWRRSHRRGIDIDHLYQGPAVAKIVEIVFMSWLRRLNPTKRFFSGKSVGPT